MSTPYPLVLTKQYQEQVPRWLNVVRLGESASILFFPKTDRMRRFQQLIEDKNLQQKYLDKKTKYSFHFIDFSTVNIEDKFDIEDYLSREFFFSKIIPTKSDFHECINYFKKNKMRIILILYEAEKYLTPANNHVLNLLSYAISKYSDYISLLSLFETDITHPSLLKLLPSTTNLYDNLFHYPLYSMEEADVFIKYLQQKWNMQINKKEEKEIVEKCGGHFWLVKEAVREVEKTGHWSEDSDGISFRLNGIYSALLSSEQKILEKIALKKHHYEPDEKKSLAYFKIMKMVNTNNQSLIPILEKYLVSQSEISTSIVLQGNNIFLNKVPVEKIFSRKEYRVLKLLTENKNKITSRDKIGEVCWPHNTLENYSDWAIDQIVSRLRKKFIHLSLSSKLIQAIRGRGYRLNMP